MANSSAEPLPLGADQAAAYLTGLESYLCRVAAREFPFAGSSDAAVESFLSREIRVAQGVLEDRTRRPFFVTHFCTEELANQLAWVQGVDFDEIVLPLTYDTTAWQTTSGRTELTWAPLALKVVDGKLSAVGHYWLALAQVDKIAEVPVGWIQADALRSTLHLMPQALTDVGISYFTLFAMHPAGWRSGLAQHVPLLVHVDYWAGLCERTAVGGSTPYDPVAYPKNTRWPQVQVAEYQQMIGKLTAASLYRKLSPALNRGGVSLSIDGISRSVNPQLLSQMANENQAEALDWADGRGKAKGEGVGWVFVGR